MDPIKDEHVPRTQVDAGSLDQIGEVRGMALE
jgi:hypothetical protein